MDLELIDSESSMSDRTENICRIWIHYKPLYITLGSLLFIIVGIVLGVLAAQTIVIEKSLSSALATLFPEATGILFTVVVIDRLNDVRTRQHFKQQLVRELVSTDRGLAMRALRELHANSWITDGSLKTADLQEANLRGANLVNGNLSRANLRSADLGGANLKGINLCSANLYHTNLENAHLEGSNIGEVNGEGVCFKSAYLWKSIMGRSHFENADFRNASLVSADLQGCLLTGADFRGANLSGASLKNASLEQAQFDASTQLPNGLFFNPLLGVVQLNQFIE